jgi:flagellar hook assembly protein FlgD
MVFTLDNNLVRVLSRGQQASGSYMLTWDGTNAGGQAVARGMYIIRATGPGFDETRKVMVVK